MSAPLTKVDEIVILSGENNKLTSDVNRLLAEIPASVHALTGVDLSKVRRSIFCFFLLEGRSLVYLNLHFFHLALLIVELSGKKHLWIKTELKISGLDHNL